MRLRGSGEGCCSSNDGGPPLGSIALRPIGQLSGGEFYVAAVVLRDRWLPSSSLSSKLKLSS
jgi:hypothetical protein